MSLERAIVRTAIAKGFTRQLRDKGLIDTWMSKNAQRVRGALVEREGRSKSE